jgi:hypothetical protein
MLQDLQNLSLAAGGGGGLDYWAVSLKLLSVDHLVAMSRAILRATYTKLTH